MKNSSCRDSIYDSKSLSIVEISVIFSGHILMKFYTFYRSLYSLYLNHIASVVSIFIRNIIAQFK